MPTYQSSTQPLPDADELVRQAQAGDAEAFGRLYTAYVGPLYRYVILRVNDEPTAEDLTAQVFMKAWDKLTTFEPGRAPFLGWLYRIAHNAVVDYYRTHKVALPLEEEPIPDPLGPRGLEEQIEQQFQNRQLRNALGQLTDDQQQVLIMRFIGEMDTLEIARQLDKKPGAVRALQMRGLQALAKILAAQGDMEQEND